MAKKKRASRKIQIILPESGVTGQCLPESLKVWERQGWVRLDDWTDADDETSEPEQRAQDEDPSDEDEEPSEETEKKETGTWLA